MLWRLLRSSGQHLTEVPILPLLAAPMELPTRIQLYHSVPHPNLWLDGKEEPCLRVLVAAQHSKRLGSRQTSQQACLELEGAQLPQERMDVLCHQSLVQCFSLLLFVVTI